MSKRRKVEETEAEALVAAWHASGEPLPAWCSKQGIDGRSFRYWVDRASAPVLRLVELTPPRPARTKSGVRLRLRDISILVEGDFSEDVLARVLRVVRAC